MIWVQKKHTTFAPGSYSAACELLGSVHRRVLETNMRPSFIQIVSLKL